jgi:hypothetical protein
MLVIYFIFYSIHLLFSPDWRGNPFFNCFGLKPKAIEKRLERKAGIAITENAQAIRS